MIRINRDGTASYPGQPADGPPSISFDPGESVVYVGGRGFGKTALQQELLAYLSADALEAPAPEAPAYRSRTTGENFPIIVFNGVPVADSSLEEVASEILQ